MLTNWSWQAVKSFRVSFISFECGSVLARGILFFSAKEKLNSGPRTPDVECWYRNSRRPRSAKCKKRKVNRVSGPEKCWKEQIQRLHDAIGALHKEYPISYQATTIGRSTKKSQISLSLVVNKRRKFKTVASLNADVRLWRRLKQVKISKDWEWKVYEGVEWEKRKCNRNTQNQTADTKQSFTNWQMQHLQGL